MGRGRVAGGGRPLKVVLDLLAAGPRNGNPWIRVAAMLAAIFIGSLFVMAALPKIQDPLSFAKIIYHYKILPDSLVNLAAIYLPWLELACGTVIIFIPWWRAASGWLIAAMLVLFAAGMGSVLARGLDISCGCFSTSGEGETISGMNIVRNASLLAGALFVIWAHSGKRFRVTKTG